MAFAEALLEDMIEENRIEAVKPSSPYGMGAKGWENGTIESFLEAAVEGSKAREVSGQFPPADNPWKWFANFLYLGKIYE